MNNKNLIYILISIIWLLVIALGICVYSRQSSSLLPMFWTDWTVRRFWSWSRWPGWSRMWSWIINNFSSEDKAIIDELKQARDSWDKDKERELMDKLRNSRTTNAPDIK